VDKRKVVAEIQSYLAQELAEAHKAGDESRMSEIQSQLTMYKFLPVRDYGGPGEVVAPSALVGLKYEGHVLYCLMVPKGGGLVTRVEGEPVQGITPHSPLGEALLGKTTGDSVEVVAGGRRRSYEVISLQ